MRTNKTVSFSHLDEWERDLLDYALDPARGRFGPYVKRLIERDRVGLSVAPVVTDVVPAPTPVGKTEAKAFL